MTRFVHGDIVRYTGAFLPARGIELVFDRYANPMADHAILRHRDAADSRRLNLETADLHHVLECPALTPDPKPDSPPAYPDGNPKSAQGAKKHPLSYMPTAAIVAANEAFADGRAKYGAANWREKGVSNMVYIEAAMRHLALYADGGEEVAADSGAKHLGHAIACLAIILDADSCGVLQDHRPAPNPNLAKILSKEAK